jgi:hypothetical protein
VLVRVQHNVADYMPHDPQSCCASDGRLEHLAQHERGGEIRGAGRIPGHREVDVDLELVGEEQMQCRAAGAGPIHRLAARHPIQCPEEGLVIEQTHLEHISQERVAELDADAGQLAREVGQAEGPVQVATEGLSSGKSTWPVSSVPRACHHSSCHPMGTWRW